MPWCDRILGKENKKRIFPGWPNIFVKNPYKKIFFEKIRSF